MKNLTNHWYKFIGLACVFLFLFMVYRREARMRTHIEEMEARITALEQYNHGKEGILHCEPESSETKPVQRPMPASTRKPQKSKTTPSSPSTKQEPVVTETSVEESDNGKFRHVVKLELNTVDSATLVRVPGIGEGTARTILQYREKLGGYYSVEQLRERLTWESAQKNLDTWCNDWFWTDENLIRKLKINKLSFKELVHHPYLDYEEVKAIVKWRDRHEKVHNLEELRQIGIDDSTKLDKLLHYVEF